MKKQVKPTDVRLTFTDDIEATYHDVIHIIEDEESFELEFSKGRKWYFDTEHIKEVKHVDNL